MADIQASQHIVGVKLANLQPRADERGRFMETFRKEWFAERSWDIIQTNCSQSRAGVLRGLHYHRRQVDYWFSPGGRIRVGLVDLRPGSPTQGASQLIEIGDTQLTGIFIPIGVAHGFLALTDATLIYLVDNYHDGQDELGVAWNDPAFNLDWGTRTPTLSARDRQNQLLKDIPPDRLPPPYRG
jgi:dTDP-4-dehydrorhamnose 3,5-epimerase